MWRLASTLLCLSMLGATCAPASLAAPPEAWQVRRLWTGDGPPVDDAVLVVQDGHVVAAGPRSAVEVPEDARLHELANAVIIPGLVVAETGLTDGPRDAEEAISPSVQALDGFRFETPRPDLLAGGVTTIHVAPSNARLLPGQGAVVKLAGADEAARLISPSASLRMVLTAESRNPPRIYEPPVGAVSVERPLITTRPQLAASLPSAVAGLRAILEASAAADVSPATSVELAAVRRFREDGTFRVAAYTAAEVRAAVELAREFDLRIVLSGPRDLEPFTEQFASWTPHVRGVILNAGIRPGRVAEVTLDEERQPPKPPWTYADELRAAGIPVAVRPADDGDMSEMLFVAGLFLRSGLSHEDVLRTVTSDAAAILGVADRVGSLTEGRDADFVILDADPFGRRATVRATYIAGERVHGERETAPITLVQAGAVYTGDGTRLERGQVVVESGEIRGVGTDVSAPAAAEVHHFPNGVIVPGLVDVGAALGMGGPLSGSVPLQTRLGEQLDPTDPALAVARSGGLTTALLVPSNAPSPVVAFKLGDDARVVRDPVAIRFQVTGNLTSSVASLKSTLNSGKTYYESWEKYKVEYAEYEEKLREYEAELARYEADQRRRQAEAREESDDDSENGDDDEGEDEEGDGDDEDSTAGSQRAAQEEEPNDEDDEGGNDDETEDSDDEATDASDADDEAEDEDRPQKPEEPQKPRENAALEPYRSLFAGEIPALVQAESVAEVRAAVSVFRDDFDLRTVLVTGNEAVRVRDLLAEKNVAVVVGPQMVGELDDREVNVPQMMTNAGVPIAFQSRARTGAGTLPLAVQFAVHKGLGSDDALHAFTSQPARLLSLDDRLGLLAPGRDADLVVLSGPPFDPASEVLAVMIDGNWVYRKENAR